MKSIIVLILLSIFFIISPKFAFADTPTPTPSPTSTPQEDPNALGNSLNGFFSSFNWIADGLIFSTPDVTHDPVTLQDGTTLGGISNFENIFHDIAIPLFAIIVAATALLHIGNDNNIQLMNFLKRLAFVAILFILSPYIFSYSIQFINLLDVQIQQQAALNLITFLTQYVQSGDFNNLIKFSISPLLFFSPTVVLQMLIVIISMGFLLIGFLYIVFQAVIRFVALLVLTVLLPVAIPFALSEKTENITSNFFKTWFTFLIQQPAFVLGFALVTTLFANLLKAHSSSIGTLFIYAGSLIFLGGVNVFIARIFGNGWELMRTNAQSMIGAATVTGFGIKSVMKVKDGALTGKESGIRNQIGAAFGRKMGFLTMDNNHKGESQQEKARENYTRSNQYGYSRYSHPREQSKPTSVKDIMEKRKDNNAKR